MRHALASLVLALFLFPSIAFGETMDDLVKRKGLYYKKYTDVPVKSFIGLWDNRINE